MLSFYNKNTSVNTVALLSAYILGIVLLLTGCDIFSSGGESDELQDVTYTVYNNINDPLLFSAVTTDGDSISYHGERNEQGIPTSIIGGTVLMNDKLIKTKTDEFFIDNETIEIINGGLQNMPSTIITDDVTFHYEWESPTEVVITSIENDGQHRSQIAFDLSNLDQDLAQKVNLDQSYTELEPLNNLEEQSYSALDFACSNQSTEMGPVYSSSTTNSSSIFVNRCGTPLSGAYVSLSVEQTGQKARYYTATPLSEGRYVANIPIGGETMGKKVDEACKSVINTVGKGCDAAQQLKLGANAICAKIALSSGPLAPKVGAACLVGINAYAFYCATANWSPEGLVPGAKWTSPGEAVCSLIGKGLDRGIDYFGEELVYSVNIAHENLNIQKGEGYHEDVKTSPANGPYPDININIEGEPVLTQLRADPPNPAEGKDYEALVSLSCASQGNVLGITIVGSDGYTDSKTCTGLEEDNNMDCYLRVPGAEGGVKDIITITLDGSEIGNLTVVFRGGSEKSANSKYRR